jgi:Domain of unknown function (DUF4047)
MPSKMVCEICTIRAHSIQVLEERVAQYERINERLLREKESLTDILTTHARQLAQAEERVRILEERDTRSKAYIRYLEERNARMRM